MKESTKNFIRQWLDKADEDLIVVKKLTESELTAKSSICFHCQQASEKYLKAYLIYNEIEPARTHNIEYLLSKCSRYNMEFKKIDPLNLSDFGVHARYPGDFYIPDEEEIYQYIEISKSIRNLVKSTIKL